MDYGYIFHRIEATWRDQIYVLKLSLVLFRLIARYTQIRLLFPTVDKINKHFYFCFPNSYRRIHVRGRFHIKRDIIIR